jgi:hypothetical protein
VRTELKFANRSQIKPSLQKIDRERERLKERERKIDRERKREGERRIEGENGRGV